MSSTPSRRRFMQSVPALGTLMGTLFGLSAAQATEPAKPAAAAAPAKKERFPGDPPEHHIVYQINHAEWEYIEHILNSISAMLTKYEDNVGIAVVVFGAGIHLLAKNPKRDIPELLRQRVKAQAKDYGVKYIACGNTMKTVGWEKKDMVDFAQVEEVGAAAIMELQEKGYAYLAW
jgi:intracellular sulfur oxidation DsrE/DsrF family protein